MKAIKKRNRTRILSTVFVMILSACTIYTIVAGSLDANNQNAWLYRILMNPFVSGIIYTVSLLYVVYAIQIDRSKRKIKLDFRCNEVMDDVDHSISVFKELIPSEKNIGSYKDFIIQHRAELSTVKLGFTYYNNNILIESLKRCFFINLNFELLAIINNIENRLPNITDEKNPVGKFLEFCDNTEASFSENDAKHYLVDLKFLGEYWRSLLNYLEFDNSYSKELAKYYNHFFEKYDLNSIEDMSLRIKMIQKLFDREIKRKIRKEKR